MVSQALRKCQVVIFATITVASPQFNFQHSSENLPRMRHQMSRFPPIPPLPPDNIDPSMSDIDPSMTDIDPSMTDIDPSMSDIDMDIHHDIVASHQPQKETLRIATTTENPSKCVDKHWCLTPQPGPFLPIPPSFPLLLPPLPMHMAVPLPGPLPAAPVQFAVPGVIPIYYEKEGKPKPPPCPPCSCDPCTPSFWSYCSPCHQKCRCRNPKDAPVPLPPKPPLPLPGPAFPVPQPIPGIPYFNVLPFLTQMVITPSPKKDPCKERKPPKDSTSEEWSTDGDTDGTTNLDSDQNRVEVGMEEIDSPLRTNNNIHHDNNIFSDRLEDYPPEDNHFLY